MSASPPDADRLFRRLAHAASLDLREVALHFRPLRGRVDVAEVLEAAAALREDGEIGLDRLTAILGEALALLAQPADLPALERFVRRRELGPELRGEVAFAASCLGVEPESLIDDDDPDAVGIAMAPLRGMLERLASGDPGPWIEIYRTSDGLERDQLLATVAVGIADGILPGPLASALIPLYGAEEDAKRREGLVAQLVEDPCEASADALSAWREIAPTRSERTGIRRGLHRLEQRGFKAAKRSRRRVSAWITSCDGVANYSLAISLEAAAGRDVNLVYLLNLDSGLRDASVIPAQREELVRSAHFDNEAILRVEVPAGEAVRRVRTALAAARALGMTPPESFSESEPWLEKVPVLGLAPAGAGHATDPGDDTPRDDHRPSGEQVLSQSVFNGWYCLPDIDALATHLFTQSSDDAAADRDIERVLIGLAQGESVEEPVQSALRETVRRAIRERLGRNETRELFARMLVHQADVLRRLGREAEAEVCEASGADLLGEAPLDTVFGRWLVEQSLRETVLRIRERSFAMPHGEARLHLREKLAPDEAPTHAHVMHLDFCEVAFEAASEALDEIAPRNRLSDDDLTDLAAPVAMHALQILSRRSGRGRRRLFTRANFDALVRKALQHVDERGVATEHCSLLAGRMASAIVLFGHQICDSCPWQCIDALDTPAPDLYYGDDGHPADRDEWATDSSGPSGEDQAPTLLSEVMNVLVAFEDLGLDCSHGAQQELEALCDELEAEQDAGGPPLEIDPGGDQRLSELTRRALREAADPLPDVGLPPDSEARAAVARYDELCRDVLPAELMARLIDRAPGPGPLLGLLFRARRAPTMQAVQEVSNAVMNLWNHTPRRELGGRTPMRTRSDGGA